MKRPAIPSIEKLQQWIFLLFLFLIPISKAAIEILFWFLCVLWIIRLFRDGLRSSIWTAAQVRPVGIALAAFFLTCAASLITSSYLDHSITGLICKTLQYIVFFLLAGDLVKRPGMLQRCVPVIAASASLICLDAIAQEFIGFDPLRGHSMQYHYRMTGTFKNPNDLAIYLIAIIPILVAWALSPKRKTNAWLRWAALGLALGCLARTLYLIGFAATFLGFFLFGLLHPRSRKRMLPIGVVLLVIAAASMIIRGGYWTSQFSLMDPLGAPTGLQDRLWMWGAGWKMLIAHPWLGVGLNTFMANYLAYWVGGEKMPRYTHNCYLQHAAETGIFGLAALLSLLVLMTRQWLAALKVIRDEADHLAALGVAVGMVLIALQSAVDTTLYAVQHATLFWTLAGGLTGFCASSLRTRRSA